MQIIKLDPLTYPYYLYNLQQDFPHISFPKNMEEIEDLSPYGCAWVKVPEPPPYDPHTQRLIENDPELIDGEWHLTYKIKELNREEIVEITPSQWDNFRKELLANELYNEYIEKGMLDCPAITINLCISLFLLDDTKIFTFKDLFYLFCDKVSIIFDDRDIWAEMGEKYFLPTYFIDILRGYA